VHTGFWWGNLTERDHEEKRGVDGRIMLRRIIWKWFRVTWTGMVWLRIGTDGRLL
jgi:hypothetical protein